MMRIFLRGRISLAANALPSFVDFDILPRLSTLEIEAGKWSGFGVLFTGSTSSLTTCVLKGALVLNQALNTFFDRMSTSLQYLHCCGTHFVTGFTVRLKSLKYLALHRVVLSGAQFPFQYTNLETFCLEPDEIYTLSSNSDMALNHATIAALDQVRGLKNLFLRSTMAWPPTRSVVDAIRSSRIHFLMLDGSVILDPFDQHSNGGYSNLRALAQVGGYIKHVRPVVRSISYNHEYESRKAAFDYAHLPTLCVQIYNDLISHGSSMKY
ncbi:hypothetical protein LTS08_008755 [Lithohypha guttulata]|uniref:Uncharacterized protein n=2 Tax=Lithohypha guttulata TaxID=1690604 RepID=A0AAN7QA85_9EURO|nr:hypothetical protein LTR05_008748 [Lithohypha guttulata]KAK5094072.1 hypothetical protein LTS08_008755 [Lithohypha guttulata]